MKYILLLLVPFCLACSANMYTYKYHHDNGNLWMEETYKDGKLEGLYREYYESGQLMDEITYKNGLKNGSHKSYHENGKLWTESTYKDGKIDGLYRQYYSEGQLWKESFYKDGNSEGQHREYHLNGKLWTEINYKDDKRHGLYKVYLESGILMRESFYENGIQVSVKEYYESGALESENYKGLYYREYYESGALKTEKEKDNAYGYYGIVYNYYENGQLCQKSEILDIQEYQDGVQYERILRHHDADGELRYELYSKVQEDKFYDENIVSGTCYDRALTQEELESLNTGDAIVCSDGQKENHIGSGFRNCE
jgi:antitoxin component YwqK of YwqJK toxin-antitoxin module